MKRIISKKLRDKSDNCKFVRYAKELFRYYFYHPVEKKVFISKYVTFLEKFFFLEVKSGRKIKLKEVQEPQTDI
jgi:hypothetical protein